MKPTHHLYTSIATAAVVYPLTGSLMASLGCIIAGVFIDVDHLLEFFMFSKQRFSVKNFMSFFMSLHYKKAFVLFHSYELIIVLWLICLKVNNVVAYGAMLGYTIHMVFDMIFNPVYWYGYFLSFRLATGFSKEKFIDEELHFRKYPNT
ncbi:MAG: hypothetical protein HZA77_05680 [Candidatus Schekmanbacteria bacterium]|nr:hypothetical protein [Candidatus Schekmanbacteria bacterium]